MTAKALTKASDLLDGSTIDAVASWADKYRGDHRETAPWHYIDIPLAESENRHGARVSQRPVRGDEDETTKAQALKFVIHFVGDLHQPLHD